jgi:hypothetical protein
VFAAMLDGGLNSRPGSLTFVTTGGRDAMRRSTHSPVLRH